MLSVGNHSFGIELIKLGADLSAVNTDKVNERTMEKILQFTRGGKKSARK